MPDRMVRGEVAHPGSHQETAGPHLFIEGHWIRFDGRIGDQPGLQVTPSGADRRDAPDEAMQRQPMQPLLQSSVHVRGPSHSPAVLTPA